MEHNNFFSHLNTNDTKLEKTKFNLISKRNLSFYSICQRCQSNDKITCKLPTVVAK